MVSGVDRGNNTGTFIDSEGNHHAKAGSSCSSFEMEYSEPSKGLDYFNETNVEICPITC